MAPTTTVAAPETTPSEDPTAAGTHPTPAFDNPRDLATQLAIAKVLGAIAKAREDELRALAPGEIEPGETIIARSPADRNVKLGKVQATTPKPVAVFTDRPAFDEWMFRQHDDKCHDVDKLIGSPTEIIAALRAHCPADVVDQLVTVERTVPDWAPAQVLAQSAAAGEPVGIEGELGEQAPPGVTVQAGASTIRISLDKAATEHVSQLWQDGITALAGRSITAA